MKKHAIVIGAGFAGLSSACLLLKEGWQVTVLEKNSSAGGRARLWEASGYKFDMGPSWYLMPEVFERFFDSLGKKLEDYVSLSKLKTHYKVFFEKYPSIIVTERLEESIDLFESFEPGGGAKLRSYMQAAQEKYEIAMNEFLYKDYKSVGDFLNRKVMTKGLRLGIFQSLERFVSKYFSDRRAQQILEYAMVFLGNSPHNAPALYSIMSHVDLKLGVYFPEGGLNGVAVALERLAKELGAQFVYDEEVLRIEVEGGRATGVRTAKRTYAADLVLNAGDYSWGETQLLERRWQTYPLPYWKKRTFAPSMFLVFLGVKKKLASLEHHNLYFSDRWNDHFRAIFDAPQWPENPCFYLSAITKTDANMAPPGCENLFLLIPAAPGLEDPEDFRKRYLQQALDHVEKTIGESFQSEIEVCRVYSQKDFSDDYRAWGGTALGLAHTLFQTAIFRPGHRSKKVKNLFYTGQYTHPGVGVPMTLISSQIVANEIREVMRDEK